MGLFSKKTAAPAAGAAAQAAGPSTSAFIPGAAPAVSAALTTGALPYATVPAVPVTQPIGAYPSAYPAFGGFPGAYDAFGGYGAPIGGFAPTVYGDSFGYGAPIGAPVGFGAPAYGQAPFVTGPAPVAGPIGQDVLLNKKSREALAATPVLSSFPGSDVLPLTEISAFGIPRGTALAGANFAARPSLPNFNPETENFIRYVAASQGIHPNEFLRRVGQDPKYLSKSIHPSQKNDRSDGEILRMIAPYLSRPGIFVP